MDLEVVFCSASRVSVWFPKVFRMTKHHKNLNLSYDTDSKDSSQIVCYHYMSAHRVTVDTSESNTDGESLLIDHNG